MKFIKKTERQATCPACETLLCYEGHDLRSSSDRYYIECPICGERIYFESSPMLDNLYMESHDHYQCSYMDATFRDDRP